MDICRGVTRLKNNTEKLINVLSQVLNIPANKINDNTDQEDVASWNSLAHLNLILAVEEAFNIRFNTAVIPNLTNVAAFKQELRKADVDI